MCWCGPQVELRMLPLPALQPPCRQQALPLPFPRLPSLCPIAFAASPTNSQVCHGEAPGALMFVAILGAAYSIRWSPPNHLQRQPCATLIGKDTILQQRGQKNFEKFDGFFARLVRQNKQQNKAWLLASCAKYLTCSLAA